MKKINNISIALLISLLFLSFCLPVMAASGKININTATKKELVTLKHVGDIIADRIIEYRKDNPFEEPEDIMKVKGIAQKIFDANKHLIIVKDD
ncbi:MAG: helix-hairpin-helix domain-containing protein [Desulfobacula sp.]|jgi:competence protein ComEA|nr:helix-hairpin-helix domain-containing protein [Desulfobacula sp.]